MRIMKPQQLVVIKGGYQIGRESRLGVSVVAGCYLSRPEHFVSEAQIWEAWKQAPLSVPLLDAAEPKPFAEYLIAGHAGIGQPVKTLNVSATIGVLSRQWRVEGEGRRGTPEVEPFLRVPLDHPSAWGGANVKENPLGRGSDDGRRPLLMTLSVDGAAQECSPLAAPTPVPHEFMTRKRHIDNVANEMVTQDYVETVFPGLPAAIDPRYFQMAPPAQWLSEVEWPDAVPYALEGFRAENAMIRGILPAVRAQAFVRYYGNSSLESLTLQRKTLWFLPDNDMALMVFSGYLPIAHLLDEPIVSLMVALERCEAPRPFTHYQQVYQKRSDDAASPFEFLLDPDLMPVGMGLNVIGSTAEHPNSLRYDTAPTELGNTAAYYQRIRDAIDAYQRQQNDDTTDHVDWDSVPTLPEDNNVAMFYQDIPQLKEKNFNRITFDGHLTGKTFVRCYFAHGDFSRATLEGCTFEHCVFDAVNFTRSTWKNVRMVQCSLLNAVLTDSRLCDVTFDSVTLEALSGQCMQITHSTLSHCVFNKGDMTGSTVDTSVIGNGMFEETVLTDMRFVQGGLDACVFNRCVAEGISLVGGALTKDSILGGNWRQAHVEGCHIESLTAGMDVSFARAQFSDCSGTKVGLKQVDMRESELLYCSFIESNFDQADLTASTVMGCDMAGGRFKDSVLTHSRWKGTSLQQGMLYNADLRDVRFERCNLAAANLAMTHLDAGTHFVSCLFERTCWVPRRVLQGGINHDGREQ